MSFFAAVVLSWPLFCTCRRRKGRPWPRSTVNPRLSYYFVPVRCVLFSSLRKKIM